MWNYQRECRAVATHDTSNWDSACRLAGEPQVWSQALDVAVIRGRFAPLRVLYIGSRRWYARRPVGEFTLSSRVSGVLDDGECRSQCLVSGLYPVSIAARVHVF